MRRSSARAANRYDWCLSSEFARAAREFAKTNERRLRDAPKGTIVVGLLLHLNLLCSYYIFIRFGLLVDAAAIFIIPSAVMGCFFSSALLHEQGQAKAEAVQAAASEPGRNQRRDEAPLP